MDDLQRLTAQSSTLGRNDAAWANPPTTESTAIAPTTGSGGQTPMAMILALLLLHEGESGTASSPAAPRCWPSFRTPVRWSREPPRRCARWEVALTYFVAQARSRLSSCSATALF